jgi:hypothetical protein
MPSLYKPENKFMRELREMADLSKKKEKLEL